MRESKRTILFLILGSFFIANAILAELIGVKIFSWEKTLGFPPLNLQLLGNSYSLNLTAGVMVWPIVFIMTDIINEYFGKHGVKLFSYIAAALIAYSFVIISGAMNLSPADFWIIKETDSGPLNMSLAYNQVFGQGLWIIIASLVAFLIGQIIDVWVFHEVKKRTGNKNLWLRANGSTLVSQFIDSFVVLFIAFYIGGNWSLSLVLGVGIVNYCYKVTVAIILTPVLYLVHKRIDAYLGKDLAEQMMREAAAED
jgi:uncharacterized integral membrane protein (TIGR00697 family)